MRNPLLLLFCLCVLQTTGKTLPAKGIRDSLLHTDRMLNAMYALHPFDEETDAIDSLNLAIAKSLYEVLNHPDFDMLKYHTLLHSFYVSCSPDSQVWSIGWYLNNGGSWMMQYGGYYFQNQKTHKYLPDRDEEASVINVDNQRLFQPFSGVNVESISLLPSHKNRIYLCKTYLRTCGTCVEYKIITFTVNDSGIPREYNSFDSTGIFQIVCRTQHVNSLDYNSAKKRIEFKLLFDDINKDFNWFEIPAGKEKPIKNYLQMELNWKNEKFQSGKIKRSKIKVVE